MRRTNKPRSRVALAAVSMTISMTALAGCTGTSPNLSTAPGSMGNYGTSLPSRSPAGKPVGSELEASLPALEPIKTPENTFVAEPYLQLGDHPNLGGKTESMDLLWQVPSDAKLSEWSVETRESAGGAWKKTAAPLSARTVAVDGVKPHQVVVAPLANLKPGALFDYRVVKAGKPIFTARGRARRDIKSPFRVVVFGDPGAGGDAQKQIAQQTQLAQPDFVLITGDIAGDKGTAALYQSSVWPTYNAATAGASGVSLLRSVPFFVTPGAGDLRATTLEKDADSLAYFYYWSSPLNGPAIAAGDKNAPPLGGAGDRSKAFTLAAGANYPKMANYSFDWGDTHWTVLDAGASADWSDPALHAWLEKDLSAGKKSAWRFVALHRPPFQSGEERFNDQGMRLLAPLFQKYGVNIVWSGDVANYQRSFPLTFSPEKPRDEKGRIDGKVVADTTFDGQAKSKASAPIYIVSGAGGAALSGKIEGGKLQPFTAKFNGDTHSMSVVDVSSRSLTVKQIGADGKEIDTFMVTR